MAAELHELELDRVGVGVGAAAAPTAASLPGAKQGKDCAASDALGVSGSIRRPSRPMRALSMKTRSRGPLVAQTSIGRLAQPCGAEAGLEAKSACK
jgi:hypothetical protein